MFGCRPYQGENVLLIDSLWPSEREVICDHCGGKGDLPEPDDDANENAGIVIYEHVTCPVCKGEKTLEVR